VNLKGFSSEHPEELSGVLEALFRDSVTCQKFNNL
jgi:hypothetical protein